MRRFFRLLRLGLAEGSDFADTYVKANSLTALFDTVLVPMITLAEVDAQREQLDSDQPAAIHQNLHDMIEDLGTIAPATPAAPEGAEAPEAPVPLAPPTCSV